MSNPWNIDESEFYELESHEQQMRFLLRYAILAPSGHNAQPWSFGITPDGVQAFADTSRRLLVADADDRELLMSLGAAITNFRVAAAHFGFETTVAYETGSWETLPVATILVHETCAPDAKLAAYFPAIRKRHTNRVPYSDQPLDPQAVQAICDVTDAHADTLRLVLPRDAQAVAKCVDGAVRALMARPAYRAELADWVAGAGDRKDGLDAASLGAPRILSELLPWLLRTFDTGEQQARRATTLTRSAGMMVIVTADDDAVSLVKAGETLEVLLLAVTRLGLQCSFFSAPVEVDESRARLRRLLGGAREPQLLLCIGSARAAAHATPRRPVEEVMRAPRG